MAKKSVTPDQVLEALERVKGPDLDGNIVALGLVSEVVVQDGKVYFSIKVDPEHAFQMHDQLSNQRFTWQGDRHFVRLDPHSAPAHIFVVRRRSRDERDFDYFL